MWFFGLIVVVLIGAVAVVASGRWGAMNTAYDDRPDMTVPARQALTSTDIGSARFGVGVRGYRMDEVDTLLERVAKEVAERDRRIADLERAVAPIVEAPDGGGFTFRSPYDAAAFEDTGPHQPVLVGGDFPELPNINLSQPSPAIDSAQAAAGVSGVSSTSEPPATGSTAELPPADNASAADQSAEASDDEPETSELPRASHAAAADEYERLQAEARAVLEAQSQPVTPRRIPATPTPHPEPAAPEPLTQQPQEEQPPTAATAQPQHEQHPAEPQQQAAVEQPAPTPHWTSQDEPPASQQQAAPQHWTSAEPVPEHVTPEQQPKPAEEREQTDGEPQQGEAQQAEGEGWQFWPPADQQGEGAYQRPS